MIALETVSAGGRCVRGETDTSVCEDFDQRQRRCGSQGWISFNGTAGEKLKSFEEEEPQHIQEFANKQMDAIKHTRLQIIFEETKSSLVESRQGQTRRERTLLPQG